MKNVSYKCNHCGSKIIYLSVTVTDKKGTLTCMICGETEDAKDGIRKEGYEQNRKGRQIL